MTADGSVQGASRTSRRTRKKRRSTRLRSRDVDILLALAKMRLLRTSAITELFFGAKGTAQKRLRKLFDAGLVRAIVADLASENRYALTALGHAFLVEAAGDEEVPPLLPVPRVDGRRLTHLDLLNGFRIALAQSAADGGVTLVRFRPEWELRAEDPHATTVPDAIVVVRGDERDVVIALEVDVGTEPPHAILKKLDRYEAARIQRRSVFGMPDPRPLILVQTARRARSIARAVRKDHPRIALGVARVVLFDEKSITTGFSHAEQVPLEGTLDERVFDEGLFAVLTASARSADARSAHSSIGRRMESREVLRESADRPRVTASRSRSAGS